MERLYCPQGEFDTRCIPEEKGLYYFFYDDETCLYVGKAKNLRRRIRHHLHYACSPIRKNKQLVNLLCYWVLSDVDDFKLSELEIGSIGYFKPVFNKQYNWDFSDRIGSILKLHQKLNAKEWDRVLKNNPQLKIDWNWYKIMGRIRSA